MVSTAAPERQTRLPDELRPERLRRRAVPVLAALAALVLIAAFAPGLDGVRNKLDGAAPGWLVLAAALEAGSCMSYVLLFRPVFCSRMRWRRATQIGLSELAVGAIVPASGLGGLALGAWVLDRAGMARDKIARRSVAFFLIKSSVNFVAVAVIGTLMAVGLVGPHRSLLLTALPAALSVLSIGAVVVVPRFGPGEDPPPDAGRVRRAISATRRSLIGGTAEAVTLLRSGNVLILAGSFGYWAFDNAVLWATYNAIGDAPPLPVILMGYLIGQLGGLLPLPGGVGGIDGGLIGALVVYGAPAAATAAAVLAYRLILFWLPLVTGGPAFVALWRSMQRERSTPTRQNG
jgi:uncharacterized membrane protein YbhN (UPF0104 family)